MHYKLDCYTVVVFRIPCAKNIYWFIGKTVFRYFGMYVY
nr:MAG TPA: hypothetical protein [Caudoviricetes sp.]